MANFLSLIKSYVNFPGIQVLMGIDETTEIAYINKSTVSFISIVIALVKLNEGKTCEYRRTE